MASAILLKQATVQPTTSVLRYSITDLSFPHRKSINDGIDWTLRSLSYTIVDDIAAVVAQLGIADLFAKSCMILNLPTG